MLAETTNLSLDDLEPFLETKKPVDKAIEEEEAVKLSANQQVS